MKYIAFVFIFFLSCINNTEKDDLNFQKKDLDAFSVNFYVPQRIYKNEETIVKLYLSSKEYSIVNGYINCQITDSSKIETNQQYGYTITGCETRLGDFENDTIYIYFTPTSTGTIEFFNEITLLVTDNDNFYAGDTIFSFNVIER